MAFPTQPPANLNTALAAALAGATVVPQGTQPPADVVVQPPQPATYTPSADDAKAISEVEDKYNKWRLARQPHEPQWFLNAAFIRGNQYVQWNNGLQRLEKPQAPPHRVRLVVNLVAGKFKTRLAKLTSDLPKPIVVPASTDREDTLNARATQRVLDYQWRKMQVQQKLVEAMIWAGVGGKGFWWVYWDKSKLARIKTTNPILGTASVSEVPEGDVCIEVGTPFEVLVADQSIPRIGDQHEIMRVKVRNLDEMKARYPQFANYLQAETSRLDLFQYEQQIANLNSQGSATNPGFLQDVDTKSQVEKKIVVKELFTRPSSAFPNGRYLVVAGGVLLRNQPELPYGFDTQNNPFPCVEFVDEQTAGQFWPPTVVERLVGIQKEYNAVRSRLAEHMKIMMHPKLLTPKQAAIPKNAWTAESGERIDYFWIPGMPEPKPWAPSPISTDTWRNLDVIRQEFDAITNIYPSTQGGAGQAQSGFQTNLLQEAADTVFSTDIRGVALGLEQAALKIRRLMKLGYDVPRLISVTGRNYTPDVIEFSSDEIDENADIVVYTGSALSNMPSVRSQQILQFYNAGIFGNQGDPEVQRKTLGMIDMGGMEDFTEVSRRDEDLAKLENQSFSKGEPVEAPKFYHNHNIHYAIHTDELKAPESMQWPLQQREALLAHVLLHVKFIDPAKAVALAQESGLPQLIPFLQPQMPPQPTVGGPPPLPQGATPAVPGPGMQLAPGAIPEQHIAASPLAPAPAAPVGGGAPAQLALPLAAPQAQAA